MTNRKIGHRQSRLGQPKTPSNYCSPSMITSKQRQTFILEVKNQVATGNVILKDGRVLKVSEPAIVLYRTLAGEYAIVVSHEENEALLRSGIIQNNGNYAIDCVRRIIGDK
ncbi:hypothetical protein ACOME3_000579 [Neoechinorhynchus agilis]